MDDRNLETTSTATEDEGELLREYREKETEYWLQIAKNNEIEKARKWASLGKPDMSLFVNESQANKGVLGVLLSNGTTTENEEDKKLVEEYEAADMEKYIQMGKARKLVEAKKWAAEGKPRWKEPLPDSMSDTEKSEKQIRRERIGEYFINIIIAITIVTAFIFFLYYLKTECQPQVLVTGPTDCKSEVKRAADLFRLAEGRRELKKEGSAPEPIIIDSTDWYNDASYQHEMQYRKGVVERDYIRGERPATLDRKVKLVGEFLFSRKDNEEWSRKIALDMAGRKVLVSLEFDEGKELELLKAGLDKYLTDNEDRKLFDLPPIEKAEAKK